MRLTGPQMPVEHHVAAQAQPKAQVRGQVDQRPGGGRVEDHRAARSVPGARRQRHPQGRRPPTPRTPHRCNETGCCVTKQVNVEPGATRTAQSRAPTRALAHLRRAPPKDPAGHHRGW